MVVSAFQHGGIGSITGYCDGSSLQPLSPPGKSGVGWGGRWNWKFLLSKHKADSPGNHPHPWVEPLSLLPRGVSGTDPSAVTTHDSRGAFGSCGLGTVHEDQSHVSDQVNDQMYMCVSYKSQYCMPMPASLASPCVPPRTAFPQTASPRYRGKGLSLGKDALFKLLFLCSDGSAASEPCWRLSNGGGGERFLSCPWSPVPRETFNTKWNCMPFLPLTYYYLISQAYPLTLRE